MLTQVELADQRIFDRLTAAEGVAERLRALTGSLGPDFLSTQFYTRVRVKSYDSAVKKVYTVRRVWKEPLYSFADIEDIVGLRIVTLYEDDILKAFDHLFFGMIKTGSTLSQPLFKLLAPPKSQSWNYIKSVRVYRRPRVENQPPDVYGAAAETLKARIKKEFKDAPQLLRAHLDKFKDHSRPDDYSSLHIILVALGRSKDREVEIPVEVQIRTAGEDIWEEINHELSYKATDLYIWSPKLDEDYDDVKRHSADFKKTIDELRAKILTFVDYTKRARDTVRQFRNVDSDYHRSLVVTLLFAMGGEGFQGLRDTFRNYDDQLASLARFSNHDPTERTEKNRRAEDNAAAIITQCAAHFRQLKVAFDRLKHQADEAQKRCEAEGSEKRRLERSYTLEQQRCLLCDIELLRLEILALVRFNYIVEQNKHLEELSEQDIHVDELDEGRDPLARKRIHSSKILFKRLCHDEMIGALRKATGA
jgi:ppGpp synthetase/RelA/SpoT-type nucleotidyltranferase